MQDLWSEDLASQAERGRDLGSTLCTCDGRYHALWGSLRASSVNNSIKSDEPLLASLIAPYIRDGARVMIGGSADPGILCTIGRIYAPVMPALTIVDRCKAPLELIRQFTAAKTLNCRTLNLDLLDLDGREQWDQIILHYTPNFIEQALHLRLFQSLARALTPGGTIVCTAMTTTDVVGDRAHDLEGVYYEYTLKKVMNGPMAELAASPPFLKMLRTYASGWVHRRTHLPSNKQLGDSMRSAALSILSEIKAPRLQRSVGGATIVDSCVVIVAGK